MKQARMHGFTLIEVVVALVIIAGSGATILALMSSTTRRSAEAMAATQRANIAKAYLDEALAQPVCGSIQSTRKNFNCVANYTIANEAVTDRFGNAVGGFGNYQVSVSVGAAAAPGIPTAQQRLVQVQVSDPFAPNTFTRLSGIKTLHP